jgi:hypothetical protein
MYIILGTGRLTSTNGDCTQPKGRFEFSSTTPTIDPKTYTFEGDVSGYYSDPPSLDLRNDRLHKSRCSQTDTQYFYADVSPRLDRVLVNMHASTKVFVDGDYQFPAEEESAPGYIEVRNVNFNLRRERCETSQCCPEVITSQAQVYPRAQVHPSSYIDLDKFSLLSPS